MTTQIVEIEKPVYGGAFLARVEGKAVFVPLALPGEQARVRIVEDKRGYANAETEELLSAAPERVAPACRHFGVCGGCNYQHADYEAQLRFKQAILRETLERAGVRVPDEVGILAGPQWGYRNRIRLAFDAAGRPGYRGRRSHAVIPIGECPIAAPLLLEAALAFADIARAAVPKLALSEISLFSNSDATEILASVFVAQAGKIRIDDIALAWSARVPALRGMELVATGRQGQQQRTIAAWGANALTYRTAGFDYRVDHGAFFQVNRSLVDALTERVTAGFEGKLAWDLYAGVGLFAHKLAESFEHVVAVESASTATEALKANLRGMRSEVVESETLAFLRRQQRGRQPDLIVVDPPRTGLGAETTAQLARIGAPAIVYVSCDPATLARDLRALLGSGYAIESVALIDLFPQTFHLETVVRLRHA
jgi:23S rRNA (uracil1939-C5)-methyltransferase